MTLRNFGRCIRTTCNDRDPVDYPDEAEDSVVFLQDAVARGGELCGEVQCCLACFGYFPNLDLTYNCFQLRAVV